MTQSFRIIRVYIYMTTGKIEIAENVMKILMFHTLSVF